MSCPANGIQNGVNGNYPVEDKTWVRPDGPTFCQWSTVNGKTSGENSATSPHFHEPPPDKNNKILPNVLHSIGNTPMIRINNVGKRCGLKCEVVAKCEFMNPVGSLKDRIGVRMIEDAERDNHIKPGDTLIEPTSGNTGIALALASAVKGYRCVIVMSEKMSSDKADTQKALGGICVRAPAEAKFDSPESTIRLAQQLQKEIPNSYVLNQYRNPSNPLAHYDGTAEEILQQCDGKLDMLVIGTGTGGTLTGVARKIREKLPHVKIVAVDPYGSVLAVPEELNKTEPGFKGYNVEGIGKPYVPVVLDRDLVDEWQKIGDKEAFYFAKRLSKEEGLLVGGSSGSVMAAAVRAAQDLDENQRCVVVFADSIRNYMSKFVSDEWLEERNLQHDDINDNDPQHWWLSEKVSSLSLPFSAPVSSNLTVKDLLAFFSNGGNQEVAVQDNKGRILGIVTHGNLLASEAAGRVDMSSTLEKLIYKKFDQVSRDTSLEKVSRCLDNDYFVLVPGCNSQEFSVVTRGHLLNFIIERETNRMD
ncbi:cystathionine beta-synthase-like protein isoform X1 [Nematostella vectensis]|uniref:cystathionine beta-synthase-like protein isoform X1 n=2 Tax=Nematostella vectensis TaxID=45351 RepID=UPI0020776567|nr:cystathionine beta-synthase-like protein isoform X1 [Nematostella vectensis]